MSKITIGVAAALLGISKQHVFNLIKTGHYKKVSKCDCGHATLISASEIQKSMLYDKPRQQRKKKSEG